MRALILAADGFEDSELLYPFYRLREEGIPVDVAGPERSAIAGKHGYSVEVDLSFAEVDAGQYDLLVLPGGKGPETVRLDENAVNATRQMFGAGKVVAAICHGGQVLISAGVLEGRKATCWKGIRDDLKAAGANYSDAEVVVDGNLITSRFPGDLPAFCRAIIQTIQA
ncbi:MAG: type 1 glutamine amidotransferase domain-containing protein [Candidatus Brocadiaceae bacterium]|jgi:protease I